MNEKEILENLVKECNSFTEILKRQGKAVSGASVKVLKSKLDIYNITYHFLNETTVSNKKELSEILVENSSYKTVDLKKRLLESNLKQDICEICGQPNSWNGKPLVLQLDHINGNHYDNRLENLRIVCPNCHTQTETFSSRRNKKQWKCIDCGCAVSYRSTRCPSCSATHIAEEKRKNSNKVYPTKEELSKLILSKSFVEIGKLYGVKDNAVRKWCKKFNLPYRKSDIKKLYFSN